MMRGLVVLACALAPAACKSTSGGATNEDACPSPASTLDASVGAGSPPVIPVGLDAYRAWDRWPIVRLGARAFMRSTYDRAGGNEASDASHFVREIAPGNDVALDVAGSGFLYFFRANRWHGSPWTFTADETALAVSESSTASPTAPVPNASFLPAAVFASPLALTSDTTQGGDVSWVPIGFERALALSYGHSDYGTGYFIYSTYDPGAALSQPVTTFCPTTPTAPDVLALIGQAGSDIAPTGDGVQALSGSVDLPAQGAVTIADLTGASVVRALKVTVPASASDAIAGAHLQITWDGRALPSIDAPVPLFFGTGTLFNRANAEYLVKALPSVVRFTGGSIELSTYFPMPFRSSAHIALVSGGAAVPGIGWQLRTVANTDPPGSVGYFHATYHDHTAPVAGSDLVFLDTTADEGGGDWCGSFVGTSFIFSDAAVLGTLEGDPRFFFDDSQTPQAQGTGTEEWGAGGDYWNGGVTTTLPFAGHPVGAPSAAAAMNADDEIESAYRFLLADLFPFGKNARIQLEHGGTDESTEHYQSVAYWYGAPSACLVQTDALHVSDPADEAAHAYTSDGVDAGVDTVTSRYDLGVDHLGATEIYPATTDTGRHTTGASELTLAIRPDNFGVLLRRKLDYAFADQRAEVYVGDTTPGAPLADAGTWYVAGSNTCAFVDATSETGTATPIVETSNRQWRDDEFLIPRALTQGKSAVRVRLVYSPGPALSVAPGAPAPARAWSEYRYTAYSYVMPTAP